MKRPPMWCHGFALGERVEALTHMSFTFGVEIAPGDYGTISERTSREPTSWIFVVWDSYPVPVELLTEQVRKLSLLEQIADAAE